MMCHFCGLSSSDEEVRFLNTPRDYESKDLPEQPKATEKKTDQVYRDRLNEKTLLKGCDSQIPTYK